MSFGDRDLRVFFRQMGKRVSFDGVSSYPDGEPVMGNFDRTGPFALQGMGIGGAEVPQPELRLPYNAFQPMPRARDTVTVDGVPYTVSPPSPEEDGEVVMYQLKAVS